MKIKIRPIIYLIIAVLLIQSVLGATCDEEELWRCQDLNGEYLKNYTQLSINYNDLLLKYGELKDLNQEMNKTLSNVTQERDYYKQVYENKSIGYVKISDWDNLNQNITNYFQKIYNIDSTINDIKQKQTIINISFYIFLFLNITLLGFSIYFFKKLFGKFKLNISNFKEEIKTEVTNFTKIIINKNEKAKKGKK